MKTADIIKAYVRIREIDNTIPDDVLDFMKQSAINTLSHSSLPSDWTKECSCNPDDKTGETWCCNTCGKPTPRLSTELPSDEEIEILAENTFGFNSSQSYYKEWINGMKQMRSIASARIAEVEDDNKQLRLLLTQYSEFRAECTALNDPAIIEIDDKIFPF